MASFVLLIAFVVVWLATESMRKQGRMARGTQSVLLVLVVLAGFVVFLLDRLN